MKVRIWITALGLLCGVASRGQPIITSSDMFNVIGQYYLAYANDFNPQVPSTSYPCAHLMGTSGGPQLWDFADGPTNITYRFDYISTNNAPAMETFPAAKIVEQKSNVTNPSANKSYLYFEQASLGRKVYGFYDQDFSSSQPDNAFSTPIIDFPSEIHYNDTWTTSFTISTTIDVPLVDSSFPAQLTYSSTFKVDGYGTIDLPKLSFFPVLRVNEAQTIDIAVDFDGTGEYQNVETDYTRNYYWLSASKGIVAQLNSVQYSTPPPDDFDQATAFLRMFETNHKTGTATSGPSPVTDLRISYNNSQVLLKWTAPTGTRNYRVEYATGSLDPIGWKSLGTLTNQVFTLDTAQDKARFYRVVSLP